MRLVRPLDSVMDARASASTVGMARILVGIAAILQAISTLAILERVFDASMLQLPYAAWLPKLPAQLIPLYILVWCCAAISFTIGWHTRICGFALALILGYSITLDQQTYSNHVYLLALVVLLLTLARCGGRYSLDARRGERLETAPAWPVTLLKIQLSIVYAFAALAKLNVLYISGAIMAAQISNGWIIALPDAWQRWEVTMPLAALSILTELFLAIAFWSRRYRNLALGIGVGLHVTIVLSFPASSALALTVFGLTMFALYLPFWHWSPQPSTLIEPFATLARRRTGAHS